MHHHCYDVDIEKIGARERSDEELLAEIGEVVKRHGRAIGGALHPAASGIVWGIHRAGVRRGARRGTFAGRRRQRLAAGA